MAHRIFRKFEVLCLPFHASLLLFPPAIAAVFAGINWPLFNRLAFCYTTYMAALTVSVVAYRLSPFDPLYRYPGPFWGRTSMFCHATRSIGGGQAAHFRALHDTYGDIVRIGPNHLSIRDPSLVGPILGASGIPKGLTWKGAALTEANVPFIGIQDVEEHARRRRAWNRGLGPAALKGYEHAMFSRVQQLVDLLEGQKGPLLLGKWIKYFAGRYDFMSDMFSGGSEQMCAGDRGNIWGLADKGAEIAYFLGQIPWLGVYLGYVLGAAGPVRVVVEHCRKETARRLARGTSSRDLLSYLILQNNEDLPDQSPPLTHQLLNDSIVAIGAASETLSGALVSIFHCLLSNPEAYAALQDEVDRFYPQGADACNTTHHRDMHYLTAVIHETLRLFPPAATSIPRQVPHDAATVVLGSVMLPPGTYVFLPPYVLHCDARSFVFPDTFWPERWLVATFPGPSSGSEPAPDSDSRARFRFVHNGAAFIPFSHGPMGCAGKGLAMLEMRTVVCALVQRFKIRLEAPGRFPEESKGSYLTANRLELPVVLEPRW
ncbi:cytochrome P450 [Ganoderma sinense ZZ0214-1]|uniref:Cytochrome P450 n=1 Tax=Ganoderma sinense ZZ0214-1 TaxID=1077348 RepID=A0A2G8RNU3_9APHY|nr:cytochrome P450 [Ganoderma sinense ZZ0214-1]